MKRSSHRLPALCATFLLALTLATAAGSQVIRFVDINPNSSTLDPTDPNGATGGRVNGTAVDPGNANILYAASEWGGIYKSTDGGNTWFHLHKHLPMATWDVEVDPSDSDKVYATSFYDGRAVSVSGINVSSDGGGTWTHPASAKPPAGFCDNSADESELTAFGISIDPTDNQRVYIGTSCGLAISTDGGATWTYSTPVTGAARIWDVLVSADGSRVDTCGDDGHRIYDPVAGTWSAGSFLPSGLCSLAASPYTPSNLNLFATVGTGIYETEDGGETWDWTRNNPKPQGRIPFVATNKRSIEPDGDRFQLWFGDVRLHRVTCDRTRTGPSCGEGNFPLWVGPFTRDAGGHDDMGSILFDPAATNDACPILMSSDGGVYRNTKTTSPDCHSPLWEQPTISPHGLWPFALAGAHRSGAIAEDLYFGNQDNGVFGTTNAGLDTPAWINDECCDGFDAAADDSGGGTVLYSVCCNFFGTLLIKKSAGFGTGGEIDTYPPGGVLMPFIFPDSIVRWGDKKYAVITRDSFSTDGGVFITQDIDATPIVWTELGDTTEPPSDSVCAIWVGLSAGVPTFYVQTGPPPRPQPPPLDTGERGCNAQTTADRMFKFTGTDPGGGWSEISLPEGGFGIFTVRETNPDHLLASGLTADDAFMYQSFDGGATWSSLPALDSLMRGGGAFPIKNRRGPTLFTGMYGYHQPSLVAIDPTNAKLLVAGGRDSGVFVSTTGGAAWDLVTSPSGDLKPHLPRPRHAYFNTEPDGTRSVFITSQGRGVWRLGLSCADSVDDEFETVGQSRTDDTCWGLDSNPLPVGPRSHQHCDEDWSWFNATAGQSYVVETSALVGAGSNTTLALHRDCGEPLAYDDDGGGGLASRIAWTATSDGTIDVRTRQFLDLYAVGKGYDLSITPACLDDIVLANDTISGAVDFVADNSITTGPDLVIAAGSDTGFTAGSLVILGNETKVAGDLSVLLTASPCLGTQVQASPPDLAETAAPRALHSP